MLTKPNTEHSNPKFAPFLKPTDALGVFVDALDARFDTMDDGFRAKLLDAMRWEDKQLRTAIDKAQLEAWYRTTRECAEKTVAVTYDRLTAAKRAAAAATSASAEEEGRGRGLRNGSAKGKLVIGRAEGSRMVPGGLFAV
jgi:nuclear pore complex protein Nup133